MPLKCMASWVGTDIDENTVEASILSTYLHDLMPW
jgi:hypothetical protein